MLASSDLRFVLVEGVSEEEASFEGAGSGDLASGREVVVGPSALREEVEGSCSWVDMAQLTIW